ncbi:hypothetical protein S23_65980 [Bradyrhizobium cosmicum]|uniref:Uncharacterized protein n=1 Tax=Bradyrhizobium cosmicum TaxID=1404864 RepID=A0AAI8QET7_9BRAD|nr:hypothetical protein S23_65980 [Bradyrhizobium cosmicum]
MKICGSARSYPAGAPALTVRERLPDLGRCGRLATVPADHPQRVLDEAEIDCRRAQQRILESDTDVPAYRARSVPSGV